MGDSWEDWEDEDVVVPVSIVANPGRSKFEDEDAEEEAPGWEGSIPEPQLPKPKPASKYDESRGANDEIEEALDDPLEEKLRRQRLVEEADLKAAQDLFGGQQIELEDFIPKSKNDFDQYAFLIASKYLAPHAGSSNYKLLMKQLMKHAMSSLNSQEVKDIETSIAGIRSDKLKEEKLAAGGKKAAKKAALNVGKSGGTAGLDDYVYDDLVEDEYDFM